MHTCVGRHTLGYFYGALFREVPFVRQRQHALGSIGKEEAAYIGKKFRNERFGGVGREKARESILSNTLLLFTFFGAEQQLTEDLRKCTELSMFLVEIGKEERRHAKPFPRPQRNVTVFLNDHLPELTEHHSVALSRALFPLLRHFIGSGAHSRQSGQEPLRTMNPYEDVVPSIRHDGISVFCRMSSSSSSEKAGAVMMKRNSMRRLAGSSVGTSCR